MGPKGKTELWGFWLYIVLELVFFGLVSLDWYYSTEEALMVLKEPAETSKFGVGILDAYMRALSPK